MMIHRYLAVPPRCPAGDGCRCAWSAARAAGRPGGPPRRGASYLYCRLNDHWNYQGVVVVNASKVSLLIQVVNKIS